VGEVGAHGSCRIRGFRDTRLVKAGGGCACWLRDARKFGCVLALLRVLSLNPSLQAVMAPPSGKRSVHVLTGGCEASELAPRYELKLTKTTSANGSAGCSKLRGISPRCGVRL
jgi:hypothetical protein